MLIVGLTGGIGSGKSAVASIFRHLGASIIDADLIAHEVLAPGGAGTQRVVERFGSQILKEGAIDRAALATIVFSDASALADLESITHPLIRERFEVLVSQLPDDAIVIHDVPLLAEKDLECEYHLVIGVTSKIEVRRERLALRGMSSAEMDLRMNSQLTDDERSRHCDVIIDNNSSLEDLSCQVSDLWEERLRPFEENLRLVRPAVRSSALELNESREEWPLVAQRLLNRLRKHVSASGFEHVGSTAVPGLRAKAVIDLQVSVDDLSRVDSQGFLRAGFVPHPTIDRDSPRPSAPDISWPKKFFVSADPMRPVNLHVRQLGSDGEQFARLFRNWLRAVPEARAEYQALKESLAAKGLSTAEYANAKEPWFDLIEERMRRWAQANDGGIN